MLRLVTPNAPRRRAAAWTEHGKRRLRKGRRGGTVSCHPDHLWGAKNLLPKLVGWAAPAPRSTPKTESITPTQQITAKPRMNAPKGQLRRFCSASEPPAGLPPVARGKAGSDASESRARRSFGHKWYLEETSSSSARGTGRLMGSARTGGEAWAGVGVWSR